MLLQIEGNDVFSDFLEQIPATLLIFVCGAGLLLFAAFAWFSYFKPLRKKRTQRIGTPAITEPVTTPPPSKQPAKFQTGDLPDLDDLLGRVASSGGNQPAPTTSRTPQGEVGVKLNTGDRVNAREVLSVLRDPRDGRLMVLVDDTAYRTLTDDPQIKDRFVKLMRELSDAVMKPDNNPPPPSEEPDTANDELADDLAELLEAAQDSKPSREFAPPPPISSDGAMPGDLPSYRIDDNVSVSGNKYVTNPTPELNIAQAIDSYLQHKLRHTPEMNGRSLQIMSSPSGGVRIRVDNQYFEAVDEIADPDIRAFIQSAIQEWQSRQK